MPFSKIMNRTAEIAWNQHLVDAKAAVAADGFMPELCWMCRWCQGHDEGTRATRLAHSMLPNTVHSRSHQPEIAS